MSKFITLETLSLYDSKIKEKISKKQDAVDSGWLVSTSASVNGNLGEIKLGSGGLIGRKAGNIVELNIDVVFSGGEDTTNSAPIIQLASGFRPSVDLCFNIALSTTSKSLEAIVFLDVDGNITIHNQEVCSEISTLQSDAHLIGNIVYIR